MQRFFFFFSHRHKFSWTLMTGMVTASVFNSLQLVLRWPHAVIKVAITTMRKILDGTEGKMLLWYSQCWLGIVLHTWKSQKLGKGEMKAVSSMGKKKLSLSAKFKEKLLFKPSQQAHGRSWIARFVTWLVFIHSDQLNEDLMSVYRLIQSLKE